MASFSSGCLRKTHSFVERLFIITFCHRKYLNRRTKGEIRTVMQSEMQRAKCKILITFPQIMKNFIYLVSKHRIIAAIFSGSVLIKLPINFVNASHFFM